MLKILQARLQQYMNDELQMFKLDLEKAEEQQNQIANVGWIIEKASEFQKDTCCFMTFIQISQEAGQVVWYSHLLKNFPVCCDPHSQRL